MTPPRNPGPPAAAAWLLHVLAPPRLREELAGDLHELFEVRARAEGIRAARRWYWRQVARAFIDLKPVRRPVIRRRITGDSAMLTLGRDIRYAWRLLLKQPAFTSVAVLMLALGIGANATIFSWVNALLLDPLPGASRPGELVQLAVMLRGAPTTSFSYPEYRDLRDGARTLAAVVARDDLAIGVVVDREAERAWGELVTGNYFDALGIRAWRGRLLLPSDDQPGADPVVVIGHEYWRSRFDASDAVVGRRVLLNGHPFTIVGVVPPTFKGGESGLRFAIWVPMARQGAVMAGGERLEARGLTWLTLLARLAPGVTLEQARAELGPLFKSISARNPGGLDRTITAVPMSDALTGGVSILRPVLLVLMAVAVIVLLIACANLAGLLLARASARQREMAIRLSIGAGRMRLVQQLLVEGVLLAGAGTAAALVALGWTAQLLMSFLPPSDLPIHLDINVDRSVLAFTAAVAVATVMLFALVPALQATTSSLLQGLRDGGSSGRAFGRHLLRRGLVAAQVALSITLLVGAGLCVRSLAVARTVTPGFSSDGVVLGWMDLFAAGHTAETGRAFYVRLLDRVRAMPGVESATLARRVPLSFGGGSSSSLTVEGYQAPAEEPAFASFNHVGPDYFQTLRIPLVGGRELSADDVIGRPRVAVINETMARTYWKGRDPIDGRFSFSRSPKDDDWITVVGVARDVKHRSMTEPAQPVFFLPVMQYFQPAMVVHVRAAGDTSGLVTDLPRIVREIDPNVPFYNVGLMSAHTGAATFTQRLAANLLVVFGGLALLLAAIGSYGVLSYLVGQRRREIGIRLAIGATRASVFRLIVASGAKLVAIGAVAGFLMAVGLGFALRGLLIGVEPTDPATYVSVLAILTAVGIAACALPARRAASLNPVTTLREE